MRMLRLAVFAVLSIASCSSAFARPPIYPLGARTIENQGCPPGSFSVVTSPDGGALSVLFDRFAIEVSETGGAARMTCSMEIPLHLPEGYALGVYRVDYRGFAHLEEKQRGVLSVDHGVGPRNRGHRFRRDLKGAFDGDFTFTENLRRGVLKRAGCGDAAVLNFATTLTLVARPGPGRGTMALDSVDGAPVAGLVFALDLKRCRNGANPD